MRFASPIVGSLILILLVAIPVGGTPNLQKNSNATYDMKVQISFAPPICEASPTMGAQPAIIACPLTTAIPIDILGTNITGTLGWSVTSLSGTTAVLNVTKDATISHDGLMVPDLHITHSFNESIDLATRAIISIMPFLQTEMDDALQIDQATASTSLPVAVGPNTAMTAAESTVIQPHPVYTMWWMNKTLSQGQNVTVLFFPTKVVGAGTFDFQGKTRSTWNLVFNRTLPSPEPEMMSAAPGVTGDGLGTVFSFEYDQTSGLLLSATADINIGFLETTTQPTPCDPATVTATMCSSISTMIVTRACGFSIHASLTLANTSLNLDQTLTPSASTPTGSTTGSGGSTGSSGGSGPGGSGGTSGGNNGGTGSGGTPGTGGTTGGSNPGTNSGGTPSQSSSKPPSGLAPWTYLLLAAVIVAIVAVALWVARRQSKKGTSQTTASSTN